MSLRRGGGIQGASRSKKGRQLMPRPGLLGMLGTVALGALVVVADIGEVVCSFGDRVAFATPLGAPPPQMCLCCGLVHSGLVPQNFFEINNIKIMIEFLHLT